MKIICPKSKRHKRFNTTAHEVHDWIVNEDGDFVRDLGCSEVVDKSNTFTCVKCQTRSKVIDD